LAQAEAEADPFIAARLALYAAALEVILICPLRLLTLRNLRLGVNVLNLDATHGGGAHLYVDCDGTKNDERLLWPIPVDSARLIRRYVTKFRPTIADNGNSFLFPGRGLTPRSANGMRDALSKGS